MCSQDVVIEPKNGVKKINSIVAFELKISVSSSFFCGAFC